VGSAARQRPKNVFWGGRGGGGVVAAG